MAKKKSIKQENEYVLKLAARFKELRVERGYSNYENFAYEKEIPRAQYGRYEKGEDIRFSSLVKIAQAFDMTLSELLEGIE